MFDQLWNILQEVRIHEFTISMLARFESPKKYSSFTSQYTCNFQFGRVQWLTRRLAWRVSTTHRVRNVNEQCLGCGEERLAGKKIRSPFPILLPCGWPISFVCFFRLAKKKGKKLKKGYAVFNFDGRAQHYQVISGWSFSRSFLNGKDLESCYKKSFNESQAGGLWRTKNRPQSQRRNGWRSFWKMTWLRMPAWPVSLSSQNFRLEPVTERAIPLSFSRVNFLRSGNTHFTRQLRLNSFNPVLRKWTKNQDMTGADLRLVYSLFFQCNLNFSCLIGPIILNDLEVVFKRLSPFRPHFRELKIRYLEFHTQIGYEIRSKARLTRLYSVNLVILASRCQKEKATEINANGKRLLTQPNVEDLTLDLCKLTGTQKENKENHPAVKKSKPEAETNEELKKKTQAKDGFDAWLGFLKRKWKQGRKDRKQTQQNSTTVEQMLVLSKQRMHNRFWQVLAVEETREHDVFNVWVSIDGQMSKHGVRVERSFYWNQRDKREKGETSKKVLPHRKESLYLYEHRIEEAIFEELLTSINSELCTTAVEGVYESQTPLLFRLLNEMGCMCRVNGPAVHTIWPLTSLKMVPLSEAEYLPQGSIRSIFLYKYSQDSRAIWVIFDASTSEAHFVMANKGDMQIPNLEKVYRELHQASCEEFGIQSDLTILVTQANESRESLIRNVPNLGLFPHVPIHQRAEPSSLFSSMAALATSDGETSHSTIFLQFHLSRRWRIDLLKPSRNINLKERRF
ncbi:unnamed protein product, partial [Mesorhabditis belari]|uniref:DNA polymerase epsilon catalytic subunit n=1 Tax=Mesorhabditis belari TaxID=2138241 RepID=A0AAF3EUQ1_9BILA